MAKTTKKTSHAVSKSDVVDVEVVETKVVSKSSSTGDSGKKRIVILVLVILGGGLLLFLFYRWLVVAWVDKSVITRFDLYQKLETRFGKNMTEELITEKLINSEAKNRGVVVSNEDVAAEIKKLEDAQGGSEGLEQALAFQAMTRQDLEDQTKYRLLVTKMFSDGISVTDEEVTAYIDTNKESLGENITDEVRNQVMEDLKMQKMIQEFNTWLNENRQGGRVTRLVN